MKTNILTTSTYIALIIFLIVSTMLIPMTPEHGYYVALAKYLVQGMVPYSDFYTMDTPVGIALLALLYKVAGVEASTYLSNILLIAANIANMAMMARLMHRLRIKQTFVLTGILFYFLLCYSSDALHLRMETFAVTFMLGALMAILKRKKLFTALAALLLALAVGCKLQCIVMLPAIFCIAAIKGRSNRFSLRHSSLIVANTILFLFMGFVAISFISNNPNWFKSLAWEVERHPLYSFPDTKNRMIYIGIQSIRCGVVFLLLTPFLWKNLCTHGKRFTIIATLAAVCYLTLFTFQVQVAYGMFFYPFITIALMHIAQSIGKKWIAIAVSITILLPPAALSVREFSKFGNGELRKEQNEEIAVIKEIFKEPGKAVMFIDTDKEFYIAPQIFSECPYVQPVYIGNGSLGYNNCYKESNIFVTNIEQADYIIVNDLALTALMIGEKAEIIGNKIENMKCSGTQSVMIYEKQ